MLFHPHAEDLVHIPSKGELRFFWRFEYLCKLDVICFPGMLEVANEMSQFEARGFFSRHIRLD